MEKMIDKLFYFNHEFTYNQYDNIMKININISYFEKLFDFPGLDEYLASRNFSDNFENICDNAILELSQWFSDELILPVFIAIFIEKQSPLLDKLLLCSSNSKTFLNGSKLLASSMNECQANFLNENTSKNIDKFNLLLNRFMKESNDFYRSLKTSTYKNIIPFESWNDLDNHVIKYLINLNVYDNAKLRKLYFKNKNFDFEIILDLLTSNELSNDETQFVLDELKTKNDDDLSKFLIDNINIIPENILRQISCVDENCEKMLKNEINKIMSDNWNVDINFNNNVKLFSLFRYVNRSMLKPKNIECNICYNNDISIAFEKCGHVCCNQCGSKINKCPYCRESSSTINLYF